MGKIVAGTFMLPGSDIDLIFGIGFIPDYVKVVDPNANEALMEWNVHMSRILAVAGGIEIDDDGTITPNTVDIGIQIYRGGDAVTAAQASAGNCRIWDSLDYSKAANADPLTYSDLTQWTLDSAYTGHWNSECNTTYVGAGSFIWIDGKRYSVQALASNGETATEVTLNETGVVSGQIQKISNKVSMKVATAKKIMPAGFWIDSTATLFTATTELAYFEAGTYDN